MQFADVPVTEIQGLLGRIRGIEGVLVRPGPEGGIEGIDLEIAAGVIEKRVLRDVESALMSGLGLELDHRSITVRRAPNGNVGERRTPAADREPPTGAPSEPGKSLSARFMQSTDPSAGRIRLESVVSEPGGELHCDVTVALSVDGERIVRTVREADSRRGRMRAAARATAEGIAAVLGQGATIGLEGVEEFSVCESDGVLVLLRTRQGRNRSEFYGAALTVEDEADAAARAVLDAMNRFLDSREQGRHSNTKKGHD